MQEQHLFEYTVIRVVPRPEREEFINVGVILFCKKQRFLRCLLAPHWQRLQAFAPDLPHTEVTAYLQALERIAHGMPGNGPISALDATSRFRWLSANRSTVLQTSAIHPGMCTDLEVAVNRLLEQYVL